MNLSAWLQKISRAHPTSFDLSLSRMRVMAVAMGVTSVTCPVITVAGTNGKGSTVKALEQIYHAAGQRVASLTSPHLIRFNERMRFAGNELDDRDICEAFALVEQARIKSQQELSYFEFVTLAALWHFKQLDLAGALDVVLLEVGVGGRFDAVNIIDPTISVITTIDLDHQQWLGNTREKIAVEKAGIIRNDGLVVCGDPKPPHSLKSIIKQRNAKCCYYGADFIAECNSTKHWTFISKQYSVAQLPRPNLPLASVAIALQVIALLQEQLPVELSAIKQGLGSVKLAGRWQQLANNCFVDVAHNPHAIKYLADKLLQYNKHAKVLAVFSMAEDKDLTACIAAIKHKIAAWYIAPLPKTAGRGATLSRIEASLRAAGCSNIHSYNNLNIAWQSAKQQASKQDMVVGFGSFYLVAEILTGCSSRQRAAELV